MPDLRQALRDFVATSNSGKYKDEATLMSKFPELRGYDVGVLKDFVATSNSGKYKSEDELISKFPEFNIKTNVTVQQEEPPVKQKPVSVSQFEKYNPSAQKKEQNVSVNPNKEKLYEQAPQKPEPKKPEFKYSEQSFSKMAKGMEDYQQKKSAAIQDFADPRLNKLWQEVHAKKTEKTFDPVGEFAVYVTKNAPELIPERVRKAWDSGLLRGEQSSIVNLGYNEMTDEDAKRISELQSQIESIKPSKEEEEFAKGGFSWVLDNPLAGSKFIGETIVSSLAQQLAAMKRTVPAGAAIGAAAGAPFGGIGAIPGAIIGIEAGTIAAGLNLETSQKILQSISDAGFNLKDPEQIKQAFSNKEQMEKFRTAGLKRGVPIAIMDLFTAGVAGKLASGGSTVASSVARKAAGLGVEGLGGSAGELAAQVSAGEKIDPNAIIMEGVAEVGAGAPTLTTEVAYNQVMDRRNTSASDENIARQISANRVAGDKEAKKHVERLALEGVIDKAEVPVAVKVIEESKVSDARIPDNITGEERAESIVLMNKKTNVQNQIRELEGKKNMMDDIYHPMIDQDIAKLQKQSDEITNELLTVKEKNDAIQKQTTSESMLRAEQPEVGLQEVGKGNEVNQVITEEVKQEEKVIPAEPEKLVDEYIQNIDKLKEEKPDIFWSVDKPFQDEEGNIDRAKLLQAANNGKLIKTEAGFGVVGDDGDIKGVFKFDESSNEKTGDAVVQEAIKRGGIKLDNFALPNLMKVYERNGFKVASRLPFNEEYAPIGWNKEKNGTPDVVAMVYDPDNKLGVIEKDFTDYGDAIAYRDSYAENVVPQVEFKPAANEEVANLENLLRENRLSVPYKEKYKKSAAQIENHRRLALLAERALAKVAPDVKIVLHETSDAYDMAVPKPSQGAYLSDTNTIHINLEYADVETVPHEVFHAIFATKIKTDERAAKVAREMIESVKKVLDKDSPVYTQIEELAKNYDSLFQDEERLAELFGILSVNYEKLPVPAKSAIVKFIEKIAELFGLDATKLIGRTDNSVINLLNTLSEKVAKGEQIQEGEIGILGSRIGGTRTSLFREGTKGDINAIVEIGRANGISEDAIVTVLKNRGFSDEEITTAIETNKGTAKKVQVSEELLPGYDRMVSEMQGVVEKSLNRGVKYEQAMQNAIDYMQGSKAYEDATDVQREQMVRDVRAQFEKKEKAAPSAEKVIGKKAEAKKVSVDEMTALKDQLRLEARAAREAKNDINAKRKMLASVIKDMEVSGKLSANKVKAIINKISSVNLYNNESVERFVDYAGKVFSDAEYAAKLSDANTLRKQVKKLSKSSDKAINLRDIAKKFSEINPSMVDDIDQYNYIASRIKESVKGSTLRNGDVNIADIIREKDAMSYINDEVSKQRQEIAQMQLDSTMDILSQEDLGLSDSDIEAIMNGEELESKEKDEKVRSIIKNAFNENKRFLNLTLDSGVNLYTDEAISLTDRQKKTIKEFIKMDLDTLTPKEGLAAVDALANVISTNSTAKMETVLADYTGKKEAANLEKTGIKAEPIRKYWSGGLGRLLSEYTTNLNIVFEKMFKGFNRGGIVEDMSGVTKYKREKSAALTESNKIVDDYVGKFYSKEANGQQFNTDYNNVERGMAAFMMRNVIGDEASMDTEFNRRKKLIEESIDVLSRGDEKEQKMSELYTEAYDKVLKDSNNIDDVISNTDKTNVDAVNFWIEQWGDRYENLSDVSQNVYNKILDKDINYSPDKFSKVSDDTGVAEFSKDDMSFHENNGTLYKKESGVLMEATKPTTLPKNPKKNKANMYIDLSFDKNNSNSMYHALVDVNTAATVRQIESFLNSPSFDRVVPNSKDRKLLQDRIDLYIRNARNKSVYSNDELANTVRKLNKIAAIGVGQSLGGVLQPVKQVIPVAVNTLVNAGGIDVGYIANQDKQDFINRSGYAIANRGVESQAQIDSINKLIDKAAETRGEKALKFIEKANEKWLQYFLVNPDVYVARASWISYYEQGMKQQGIDPKTINYATDEVNEKAADYAQRMVDRQQNISDTDMAGKLFASKEPSQQILVKTLMPFASFRMNQASRLGADVGTLMSKVSTVEDRKIAARSLAGFTAEMAMFKIVSIGASMLINSMMKSVMGREDDEEKDNKKMNSIIKGQLTGAVSDVFSPIPLTDKFVQSGAAEILEMVQDAAGMTDEEKIGLYSGSKQDIFQSLGLLGITGDRANQLYEVIRLSNGGTYTDDYGKEKTLTEEDQNALSLLIGPAILTNIGLAPSELNSVVRSSLNEAKRSAKGEKKGKKVDPLLQGYDTREDMKRYDPKLYEETYGEGSSYYEQNRDKIEARREADKQERAEKDKAYNYSGGGRGGFGSKSFGKSKSSSKGGFGSKGFGQGK